MTDGKGDTERPGPYLPRIGLFLRYSDAQEQARFRAGITGYRYRVRFDRANRWWHITETVKRFR